MRPLSVLYGLIVVFCSAVPVLAACGSVSIGEMNWNSARVVANVQRHILEAGYGCKVKLVETTTESGLPSHIEQGKPDILSEVWMNSVRQQYEKGVSDGRIVPAGAVLGEGGLESWWIPAYLSAEHPDLKTVADLKRKWHLFKSPSDPSKGRFYTCPRGWACQTINRNLFRAYGLQERFELFVPASGDELKAAIAEAFAQHQPWVGYYWAPTAILGRYPMVELKLGPAAEAGHKCNQRKDCESPHAGRYPASRVIATATAKFKSSHPEEFAFLSKLSIPNRIMNAVLAWGEKNKAGGAQMAGYLLQTYRPLWQAWVPEDVAEKLDASL